MGAWRICVLVSASKEQFPNKSVFIKTVSVTSVNLQSMFFIVLRRLCLSSLYMGQWRMQWEVDLTSKPQLQIGFNVSWKLCLNLWSREWLRPTRSLVISLIPLWFSHLKTLFGVGLIKFRILFLKALKLPTFGMLRSRLFHSITTEGKKKFLKKLCFVLKRGMFSVFLVV